MKKPKKGILYLGVAILIIILITGLTWANYQFALNNPGGNDFVPRWMGTQLFITEGLSPYSEEASLKIQEFFYGRTALQNEDQQLFVYPFYSMIFFLPFSLIQNFVLARTIWMTTLEIAIFLISFLSMKAMRWRPEKKVLAFFLIFSSLWYHALRPLINGNPAILAAMFISLAFLFVSESKFTAAGVLFAFSTIKPQMVVLLIPFVLLWAIFSQKPKLIRSFIITMFLLIGLSFLLQPDWLYGNLRQIIEYPTYTQAGTIISIFNEWWPGNGQGIAYGLSIFLALILLVEWIMAANKKETWFLWTASLTLVITNLIGIRTSTANYIALIPSLVLVFSVLQKRWGKNSRPFEYFTLLTFMVGLWWLFLTTLVRTDQPWQHPIMFFPLPVFLLLALYWVRHWRLRSLRMEIEELGPLRKLG